MTIPECLKVIPQMLDDRSSLHTTLTNLRVCRLKLGSALEQLELLADRAIDLDELRDASDQITEEVDQLIDQVTSIRKAPTDTNNTKARD